MVVLPLSWTETFSRVSGAATVLAHQKPSNMSGPAAAKIHKLPLLCEPVQASVSA